DRTSRARLSACSAIRCETSPPGCRARRRSSASASARRWSCRIGSSMGHIMLREIGEKQQHAGDTTMTATVPRILWQPSERAVEEAQLTQFARQVVRKRRLELNSYPDFYHWSVERPEEFWSDTWDFCGVLASRKGATVLVDGDKMPGARWFPEARLNLAENLMRRGDRGDAFVFWDETGPRRRLSYADLYSDVSRAARRSPRSDCAPATVPRPSFPTFPRPACSRSRRCRRASCGLHARRISASKGCSSASARSSPRCSSARTATATTARRTIRSSASPGWWKSCPAFARWWSCRISTRRSTCRKFPRR